MKQEISHDNLVPLAQIARELEKSPRYLARLARERVITAQKQGNIWYADKEQLKKELRNLTWSELRFHIQNNLNEITELMFCFFRFIIIYWLMWLCYPYVISIFPEIKMLIGSSRNWISFLMTLFIYVLLLFSKGMHAIKYAGSLWMQIGQLKNQVKDLRDRVQQLENSDDED